MFSRTTVAVTLSALLAVASADFQILSPGGPDLWWVSGGQNSLVWTCDQAPAQTFTVFIANPDKTILADRQAIISVQNNFDCSKTITTDIVNPQVGSGYTIQLADTLNGTHIFAESKPFDVKPLASGLPATTVSPHTATAGGTSATGSNTAQGSTSTNTNAAVKSVVGYGAAAFGALMGLIL